MEPNVALPLSGGAPASAATRERILIASDHAGVALKERLGAVLAGLGYDVEDMGPEGDASVDYADYAHPLAERVADGRVRRGVLMCGTGLGMSYAANRHAGVRASVAWNPEIAALARQHNDSNVLVLPARFVTDAEGEAILRRWLDEPFEGGRHERRVAKIDMQPAVTAAGDAMAGGGGTQQHSYGGS